MSREYTTPVQGQAHEWWAKKEAEGWEVSLVGFDDNRRVYAFNTNEPEEMLVRSCGNCGHPHRDEVDVSLCYADSPRLRDRNAMKFDIWQKRDTPRKRPWGAGDAGIYRDPASEKIFKVYQSTQSGRILCKTLVVDKFEKKGRFVYTGLASRFVEQDWRISMEEAKKFGQIYGVCCMCGRTLTDEESVANGIGPICAGKFSL